MALTKVTGEFIDISDLDLSDVGTISLDAIQGDADANTSITFSGSDVITIATGGSGRLTIGDGALSPVTDNQIDLGTASLEFKDAFFDGTVTADAFAGPLTGNVTGNASGTALTVTQAAQTAITSLGTLTGLTGGTGDLIWDTPTFVVDSSANSVGIGTTSPASAAGNTAGLHIKNSAPYIRLQDDTGTASDWEIYAFDDKLHFWDNTNSAIEMTIDGDGKVGIGTTSPQGILHLDEGAGDDCTLICETHAGGDSMIRFTQGNSGPAWSVGLDAGSGTSDGLSFAYKSNGFPSLTGEGLMCLTTAGKLGIGTTAPDGPLHVMQGSAGSVTASSDKDSLVIENSTHGGISILTPDAAEAGLFTGHPSAARCGEFHTRFDTRMLRIGTRGHADFETQFYTGNWSEAMRLDSAGNLGIGTNDPDSLLHIKSAASDVTMIKLENTNDGSYPGRITFVQTAANPADNDALGKIDFYGKDSAGNSDRYAFILATAPDFTSGTEDGLLSFQTLVNGSNHNTMNIVGGQVGIGTASPSADTGVARFLQIGSSSDAHSAVVLEDNSGQWEMQNNGDLQFWYDGAGTEKVRITTDGKVFIGASSANDGEQFKVEKNGACTATIYAAENSSARDAVLRLQTRHTGAQCRILFMDGSGAGTSRGEVYYNHDGDYLSLGAGAKENIRVNSNYQTEFYGSLASLDIDPVHDPILATISNAGNQVHIECKVDHTSSFGVVKFQNANGAAGSITMGSSSVTYNTSSDYRLKENVNYTWDATTRLKQLKPARFNWIADDTNTLLEGFIAHEVSGVVPEAITGEKDATEMQEIDQSKLIPLLVKTIQELEARIEELENA